MSRSYKKTSYSGDKNDQAYKKVSNKRIRNRKDMLDGSFFKKIVCPWFICDFCSYTSEAEFMKEWEQKDSWLHRNFKTYEEALAFYKKEYRRK